MEAIGPAVWVVGRSVFRQAGRQADENLVVYKNLKSCNWPSNQMFE